MRLSEGEVISAAGIDAAVYIKTLRLGVELFFVVSLLVCAIILPINATGSEVDSLMSVQSGATAADPAEALLYWVPPPEPGADPESVAPPPLYDESLPPAPPGFLWWRYLPGVPPLPEPASLYGPAAEGVEWRYDPSYASVSYSFSEIDKTTMANIPPGSSRLYAHAVVMWAVTAAACALMWRYCQTALRLRMLHLLTAPAGTESHTVLVTDVPGIAAGTVPDRLDGTALKLLPAKTKERAFAQVARARAALFASEGAAADAAERGGGKAGAEGGGGVHAPATVEALRARSSGALEPVPLDDGKAAGAAAAGAAAADAPAWAAPDRWAEACAALKRGASPESLVESAFRSVGADVARAHTVHDTRALAPLLAAYDSTRAAAEGAVDEAVSAAARGKAAAALKPARKTVSGATLGAWGREKYGLKPRKVEALPFYAERLEHLRGELRREAAAARRRPAAAAFVTLRTRRAQAVAASALMCEDLAAWRCAGAPSPQEIIWKNIGMRRWERSLRSTLVLLAFSALCVFYLIPIAAIQVRGVAPHLFICF